MTKDEISAFRAGYWEARNIAMSRIREVIALKKNHRMALQKLLKEIEDEAWDDHWRTIQEESPGITLEEYESDLQRTSEMIREHYYQKDRAIKLYLVKSPSEK